MNRTGYTSPTDHGCSEATIPEESRCPSECEFQSTRAWGLATAIDLYGCDPDLIRSADHIREFTIELCELLRVKRFGDPQIVRFGADPRICGYSMVQLIETSLVSAHFAEESDAVYLDVFSCRWFDGTLAAALARTFFRANRVRVHSRLRH